MQISDTEILSEDVFQASGLANDFGARSRLGIYVHVPFCPHICPYCDFVKTARFTRNDVHAYFAALIRQFDFLISSVPHHIRAVTVYLGGGTPSLFPPEMYQPLIEKISSRFEIEEFTVETNPFSNLDRHFNQWLNLGVTRVTLGAQSLAPEVLTYLGRKHTPADVIRNIESARAAGIKNIQVDVIFGIKGSVQERDVAREIELLARHGATGVSCYLLTIEESTAFRDEQNAPDESVVDEYSRILQVCERLGFEQHETSNFSQSPSIHNRLYWYGLPYLGIGTGAHGLLPASDAHPLGRRYQVGEMKQRTIPGDDSLPFRDESSRLFEIQWAEGQRSRSDALQEMLLTLLRTKHGIPLQWFSAQYSEHTLSRLWQDIRLKKALEAGFILLSQTHLTLSPMDKIRGDSWALHLASVLHPSVAPAGTSI